MAVAAVAARPGRARGSARRSRCSACSCAVGGSRDGFVDYAIWMTPRIEDHALIGDLETAALVTLDGTIDWLCLPRFDSDACMAALLGRPGHGCWRLGPVAEVREARRSYRDHTLVLETELVTDRGTLRLVDCMPVRAGAPRVVRVVECTRGEVDVESRMAARFGYGEHRPWARSEDDHVEVVVAPNALSLWSERPVAIDAGDAVSRFVLHAGESVAFTLAWHAAHESAPEPGDPRAAIASTETWWREWTARCTYTGPWRDQVVRSLVTLKALTYAPTGGIVAAPTTSLPEYLGGVRNWDYRYCWLRDTSLTLGALLDAGFEDEAEAFAHWLERAGRGEPSQLQIMYGVAGERRLTELELGWLPGYEGSVPVRIGNAASEQLQLDVYGELVECFHQARVHGVELGPDVWSFEKELVEHLETVWEQPDRGIWEVRGDPQLFTFSKIMVWVAFDRMVKDAEQYSLDGPTDHWRKLRDRIHADVCNRGFHPDRGAFTQVYGKPGLDAALLVIPQLGFLPASDPRVAGTLRAIQRELRRDGLVHRYDTRVFADGLPAGEGVFLPCSFWLADALSLAGQEAEATRYFERLLALCNDVGLLAEQYDPDGHRQLGNFPQAFTHVALVRTAIRLGTAPSSTLGPAPDELPAEVTRPGTRSS